VASITVLLGSVVFSEAQTKPKPKDYPLTLFANAQPEDYLPDSVCAGCHADIAADFGRTYHAAHVKDPKLPVDRQGCQSCHGPGAKHVESVSDDVEKARQAIVRYTAVKPAQSSAACLRCHGGTMHATQWTRSAHARSDVGCVNCHTVHHGEGSTMPDRIQPRADDMSAALAPAGIATRAARRYLKAPEPVLCGKCHRREAGEFRRNFHHPVAEGRMTCSDCHEAHPTKASARKSPATKSDCVRCHAEKAGPFRFEHDPVAGWTGDGCIECHRPHGSHNPSLLKSFSRGLCAQCHTDKMTSHNPGQTCWNSGCHQALHGSNTDRRFLTR
jgi:predicted CXXCH cytochrome family protein